MAAALRNMFRKGTKRPRLSELDEQGVAAPVKVTHSVRTRGTPNDWSSQAASWPQAHSAEQIKHLRDQVVALDPERVSSYSAVLDPRCDAQDFQFKREVEALKDAEDVSDDETVREWTENQMKAGSISKAQLPAPPLREATLVTLCNDIQRMTQTTAQQLAEEQQRQAQLETLQTRTQQKVTALTQTSLGQTETFVLVEEFKSYVEALQECMASCQDDISLAISRVQAQEQMNAQARRQARLSSWCQRCEETLPGWQSEEASASQVPGLHELTAHIFAEAAEQYYDLGYILRSFNSLRLSLPQLCAELDCERLLRESIAGLIRLETWTWSPLQAGWGLQRLDWYSKLETWPAVREVLVRETLEERLDFVLRWELDIYDPVSIRKAVSGGEALRKRQGMLLPKLKEAVEDLAVPSTAEGAAVIAEELGLVVASLAELAPLLSVESLLRQTLEIWLGCAEQLSEEEIRVRYGELQQRLRPLSHQLTLLRPIQTWLRFERPHVLV